MALTLTEPLMTEHRQMRKWYKNNPKTEGGLPEFARFVLR